jgi:hypothetical protein
VDAKGRDHPRRRLDATLLDLTPRFAIARFAIARFAIARFAIVTALWSILIWPFFSSRVIFVVLFISVSINFAQYL